MLASRSILMASPILTCLACLTPGTVAAGETVFPGDLNADAKVDVSDVLHLLEHLFREGAAPAPLVGLRGLPATGVERCSDGETEIPCAAPGETFFGQDANYRSGIARSYEVVRPDPADSFTWTTLDHATGLEWQYRFTPQRMVWRDALAYCQDLELGGFTDWRLPSVTELLSIARLEGGPPAIDTEAFHSVMPDLHYAEFWTSTTTPREGGADEAYVVSLNSGATFFSPKDPGYLPAHVRAVRTLERPVHGDLNVDGSLDLSDAVGLLFHLFAGASLPGLRRPVLGLPATGQTRCYDSAGEIPCPPTGAPYSGQDGQARAGVPRFFELLKPDPLDRSTWSTVDHATGLQWQYAEELRMMSWEEALGYCEALDLGGFGDWRLPNARELQSIADYGKTHPLQDGDFFGQESLYLEGRDHWGFWTSTPGFIAYLDLGFISQAGFSNWVRAVRGAGPAEEAGR